MSNCIFCKIVAGILPSYKVYEDEDVLAFLDIAPVNHGHVLVIPKKHFANMEEIPEDILMKVLRVVKKIGLSLKRGLKYKGYNIVESNDPVAGQEVAHIHFHIIPRLNKNEFSWPHKSYKEGEAQEVVEKIKNNI